MPSTTDIKRGKNIRNVRQLKNIKQQTIADMLNMTQQNYSELENGNIEITDERLSKIAEIMDVNPELFDSFDEKNVFNNTFHDNSQAQMFVSTNLHEAVYHQFPVELKKMYEEQIALLKDKVAFLEAQLKKE